MKTDTPQDRARQLLDALRENLPDHGLVSCLLRDGVDFSVCDITGRTAVMSAARKGHNEILRWLIAEGAPLDTQDLAGQTALHHCNWHAKHVAAGLLLAAGAARDIPDHHGNTPLVLAAWHGCDAIAAALCADADENMLLARTNDGKTAIEVADERNEAKIAELIKQALYNSKAAAHRRAFAAASRQGLPVVSTVDPAKRANIVKRKPRL